MAKKPLDRNEAMKIATQLGYFDGLEKIFQEFEVSKELGASIKMQFFQFTLKKIEEAKKEIARLQASVGRLEAACRAGTVPLPAEGLQARSPSVNRLRDEMRAFDGWTISLLETDITLLQIVNNPETAGIRAKSLAESFAQLWTLRNNGRKIYESRPDVFDLSVFTR
jgi:hypothetical protein